jgi:integrase
MINSVKQGYESTVRIERLKDGNLRLAFSTKLAEAFNKLSGNTHRVRPGLIDSSQNYAVLEAKCWLIHSDFLDGKLDASLEKYGIQQNTKLTVLSPPARTVDIVELWDAYVNDNEQKKSLNTLDKLKKHWRNALVETVNNTGTNPLAIIQALQKNKTFKVALEVLRNLDKCHEFGIKHGLCKENPYSKIAIELNSKKRANRFENNHQSIDEDDIDNAERAYSLEEMEVIIEAFKKSTLPDCIKAFYEFLFLSGCRVSEAIAVKWADVKWDKECIVIARQWIYVSKCFAPLKGTKYLPNHKQYRIFPMPKNGRLWQLLEQLKRIDNPLNLVFVSSTLTPLSRTKLFDYWGTERNVKNYGIVKQLVEDKKIGKYLSMHHTRHTFNCVQQNIYGISEKVVSTWIGHHPEVNEKHYWEADKTLKPGYGEVDSSNQKSEVELLREQNKMLMEQMEQMRKMIEQLTNKQ